MGKHFVLFVEGIHNQAEEHLRRVGLPDLIPGASFEAMGKESPSGQPGMLFRWKHEAAGGSPIKWVPARAFEGLDAKRYWLGYWPDDPPTPEVLVKRTGYFPRQGYERHGVIWPLPQAMDAPADLVWREDGTMGEDVAPECREFWRQSLQWKLELIERDELDPIGIAEWLKSKQSLYWIPAWLCFRELYRMPPELMFELRLLGRTDWTVPVSIAIGTLLTEEVTQAIEAAIEKKAGASGTGSGANTSPGVEGSASDTPVTATTNS